MPTITAHISYSPTSIRGIIVANDADSTYQRDVAIVLTSPVPSDGAILILITDAIYEMAAVMGLGKPHGESLAWSDNADGSAWGVRVWQTDFDA